MASGILQVSGQWVIDQLKKLEAAAEARRVEISMNNARIIEADKRAQKLPDAKRRDALRAQLHRMAQRQGVIAKAYRTFGAKVKQIAADSRAWLTSHGYSTGLSGLGVIQIPTAIVVALSIGAVVWVSNTWLEHANKTQSAALKEFETVTGLLSSGQTTPEQAIALLSAANRNADANMPKGDPLGLSNIAAALTPLAVIALAFVVLPPVIDAFNSRPRRRVLRGAA